MVALDPATGYQDYDLNGNKKGNQTLKPFNSLSDWSWGFYGRALGSSEAAKTAHESFEFVFPTIRNGTQVPAIDAHGSVVSGFTNLIEANNQDPGNISKYFGLDQISSDANKPWIRRNNEFEAELYPEMNDDREWMPHKMNYYDPDRDSKSSASEFKMPLPGGERWRVNQSYAGSYSHDDKAAIDFGNWIYNNGNREEKDNVPILAVADGQVISAGEHYGGGNYVVIDHDEPYEDDEGLQTYYGHLRNISVDEGEQVSQGHQIGVMGNTGKWSSGTHLHFQVEEDGNADASQQSLKNLKMDGTKLQNYDFSGWSFGLNNGYLSTNEG
jgi:murein DD-endopeptidase MepM/ murein hydrolase activator NlpD